MTGDNIFTSSAALHAAFAAGLEDMLRHEGLGVFILVCANASFDPQLWPELAGKLGERYRQHAEQYRSALSHGQSLPDADDDVLVFLKMLAIGFETLQLTERRHAGPWELQYNQLRSFRPPRNAHNQVTALHAPFNNNAFHFNKPFLRKECFWSGELAGREVELLYNKFPFVEHHALLVPQREQNRPQYLSSDDHCYLWCVTEQLGETLPGIRFGYNAYGAYASINHQHFQMSLREQPFPVELPRWQHNGGSEPYPASCYRFDEASQAWQTIERLQQENCAFNLLYLPGCVYILPRKLQGSYRHSPWTGGFAWYEMSGGMVTFSREQYLQLDEGLVEKEFAAVRQGVC